MTNKNPFKLQRGCYTQATCLATLRKVEGRSTILANRKATIAVAKWSVALEFYLQLATTCNETFVVLQVARKIASYNMALRPLGFIVPHLNISHNSCFFLSPVWLGLPSILLRSCLHTDIRMTSLEGEGNEHRAYISRAEILKSEASNITNDKVPKNFHRLSPQ